MQTLTVVNNKILVYSHSLLCIEPVQGLSQTVEGVKLRHMTGFPFVDRPSTTEILSLMNLGDLSYETPFDAVNVSPHPTLVYLGKRPVRVTIRVTPLDP